MKLSKQKMTQQVTKPNSWKIVTITLLAIVVVTGAIIGILWMGQGKQSESEYTWVKIFGDSEAYAKLGDTSTLSYTSRIIIMTPKSQLKFERKDALGLKLFPQQQEKHTMF